MEISKSLLQNLTARSFERLLRLYPTRFRNEFSVEIKIVFLQQMSEVNPNEDPCWFLFALREMAGLIGSILRERWNEWKRGNGMGSQNQMMNDGGGAVTIQFAEWLGYDGWWMIGWFIVNLFIFPLVCNAGTLFAMPFQWALSLGSNAGLWPVVSAVTALRFGLFTSLALGVAAAQWLLLHELAPRSGRRFAATVAIVLGIGVAVHFLIPSSWIHGKDSYWWIQLLFIGFGGAIGLAQWISVRRYLPHAYWIIAFDALAARVLLWMPPTTISGRTNFFILMLALPVTLIGLGIWLSIRLANMENSLPIRLRTFFWENPVVSRIARFVATLAIFVALFFGWLWLYAETQLNLAKVDGVSPTIEEAILTHVSQEFGGANVVSISNIKSFPDHDDGRFPHLWWGSYTVTYDRIPAGYQRKIFNNSTPYLHTRDGWVQMGEGLFPDFIAGIMELYNLEGVNTDR